MAIDKSLKQHYEMQGKVRNYLGKQKMVKAPVKWKSGPDHPDTELAYITKAEKDLLLKADLHDSLSQGPNKGPSGIISLNSAGGSYGSPGSGTGRDAGSGGGGNGSHDRGGGQHQRAAQAAQAAAAANRAAEQKAAAQRDMQATIAQAERAEANRVAQQAENVRRASELVNRDQTGGVTLGEGMTGVPESIDFATARQLMTQPGFDTFRPMTDEQVQKYGQLTTENINRGVYDPYGIQTPSGAFTYDMNYKTPDKGTTPLRTRIQDERAEDIRKRALGNIALQTDKSLTDISDPQRRGIMGTVKDKSIQMAKNFAQQKTMKALGLTAWNPILGAGSWLLDKFAPGKKAALKSNITNLLTRKSDDLVGTPDWQGEKKRTTPREDRDGIDIAKQVAGKENVIVKAINQYRGTEAEGQIANLVKTDLNKALQYYAMMPPKIEAGKANKQEMDAYELLGYYLNEAAPKQQNVAYGGRIDKALGGRSRDI